MKTIDAIRAVFVNAEKVEYPLKAGDPHHIAMADALLVLRRVVESYDELAPDWAKLPDWAQWYAIDANGDACAYAYEPTARLELGEWEAPGRHNNQNTVRLINMECIGHGLDWKDCLWSKAASAVG